jgi:anti-anti-sigma factor
MPVGTIRLYRPDPAVADEHEHCGRAVFSVLPLSPPRVVCAVRGEIDAVNGRALGLYVERHSRLSGQLILDLRAVEFFGCEGFTALYYLNVQCARTDVDWTVVGSRAVRRLTAICDPDGELPFIDDFDCAIARLDHLRRRRYPSLPAN